MDQTTLVNSAVVIALMLLAVSSVMMVLCLVPLISQGIQTLMAVQRLSKTLEDEVPPTLSEFREVMDGVNQIRSITARRVDEVGHKVEDVADSFTGVVDQAQKHSSVWGAGLFAGLKAYLGRHNPESTTAQTKQ